MPLAASLPLLSIPAYYLLALTPHVIAIRIATQGDPSRHDNRNYHSTSNVDKIRRALGPAQFARYERAKRCHQNHLENLPLFVAGVFAGLLAEQARPSAAGGVGVDAYVVGWMLLRVVYTVSYVQTESLRWSYLRSAVYFIGTMWTFKVIASAARVLGQ